MCEFHDFSLEYLNRFLPVSSPHTCLLPPGLDYSFFKLHFNLFETTYFHSVYSISPKVIAVLTVYPQSVSQFGPAMRSVFTRLHLLTHFARASAVLAFSSLSMTPTGSWKEKKATRSSPTIIFCLCPRCMADEASFLFRSNHPRISG
jgi:hypothetical protein